MGVEVNGSRCRRYLASHGNTEVSAAGVTIGGKVAPHLAITVCNMPWNTEGHDNVNMSKRRRRFVRGGEDGNKV